MKWENEGKGIKKKSVYRIVKRISKNGRYSKHKKAKRRKVIIR
jgi:hypothetical protein